MINILIADDHLLIREGFKKLIGLETDLTVIGEASDAFGVMQFLEKKSCDILVLDINMPGKSGLDLLHDIKNMHPDLKVLILSINPEARFAVRALKNGAYGYLTKESAGDELVNAIRKIHTGRKYISAEVAEILATGLDETHDKGMHETLSDREFQIFLLIGKGDSLNNISENLSLSLSTINTYRKRIMEKMNMKTNADIIHYVIKNNLID